MENFLFEEKRGHCEYFATAGALMARALGLPSRVAYGWAGGTWYDDAGLFVFRANEAHAWTEVWLENFGWVLHGSDAANARRRRKKRASRRRARRFPTRWRDDGNAARCRKRGRRRDAHAARACR